MPSYDRIRISNLEQRLAITPRGGAYPEPQELELLVIAQRLPAFLVSVRAVGQRPVQDLAIGELMMDHAFESRESRGAILMA